MTCYEGKLEIILTAVIANVNLLLSSYAYLVHCKSSWLGLGKVLLRTHSHEIFSKYLARVGTDSEVALKGN